MAFAILKLKRLPERLAKAQEDNNLIFPTPSKPIQLIQTAS